MKQTTVNEFKDGINLDLHPIVTPKTVLTDNLNGTFITYNGNEFCLQNDRGNIEITSLNSGFTPIGIKEHNGILYIISVKDNLTEIGTYPSPNYPDRSGDYDYEHPQDLSFTYAPLHILTNRAPLTNINFGYTVEDPVTVDIQDSYDGSVNIILISDKEKPRIINSGFSVLPNNKYKFVNREQDVFTNIYESNKINQDTELIRTSNILTNVDLRGVQSGGQWKGGNYTFYIKFGDGDFNQTDVVAESGIVSIFNGNDGVPSTISGTLLDERTDKMINLRITGLNTVYSKIYVYFTREYSDTQGFRMTEAGMLVDPIDISIENPLAQDENKYQDIWLTGFEQQVPIDIEELNVDYHTIDWARAETQHSNMLFLGNVGQKETFALYTKLKDFTLNVTTRLQQAALTHNSGDSFSNKNYYSVKNIYNYLGYWPNEFYRFAIVYVLDDGSTTPAFNMHGGRFTNLTNISNQNDYGVFLTPDVDVLSTEAPLSFRFTLPPLSGLGEYENKVKGWFVVRQKRIPTTICQGLSIGTDKRCYLPTIWTEDNNWYIESFLSLDRSKTSGEQWRHESGSAAIHQISGQPHILRPFLERFGSGIKQLNQIFPSGNADYIVFDSSGGVYLRKSGQSEIGSSGGFTNWYEANKQTFINNVQSAITSNGTINWIILEQEDIASVWRDTEKHTLTIYCYILVLNGDFDLTNYDPNTISSLAVIIYLTSDENYLEGGNVYYGKQGNDTKSFYLVTNDELNNAYSTLSNPDSLHKFNYRFIKESTSEINKNALLSLDPCVNSLISGMFDGSEFTLKQEYNAVCNRDEILFNYSIVNRNSLETINNNKTVFVQEGTKSKVMDDNSTFSNVAGSGSSAGDFEYAKHPFGVKTDATGNWLSGYNRTYEYDNRVTDSYGTSDYYGYNSTHNVNLIRGLFTPFIGLGKKLNNYGIYSIRLKDINYDNAVTIRQQDNSEYYCVSSRLLIQNSSSTVYRGDCYICKVGMRILRNFIDNTAPVTNTIVDPLGWERWVRQRSLYGGDDTDKRNGGKDSDSFASIVDYSEVNLSDLNAIDLGYWVTFPCLSSYNLGLRSLDTFHTDEMSLLGSPRSFYPLSGASAINKVGDSYLLNDGLSAAVGRKRYKLMPEVPYSKSEFANRIMFSNVNVTDAYTNGYRTFQGLSYKDYDKQYGAITKLISLGQNIFIVMEHGLGLVPVNPKALMQTTTGEAVHIYGYGVLPDEMTIISQDYGSKYEHSVIRTPIGIYGIDVDAKKIWVFSDKQGFNTFSDMHIETYLKDNLEPVDIEMGRVDIRTHYNAEKGDLMFTWNKTNKATNQIELHSICYNERFNTWVTRYDWKPVVSDNINDEFYSLNKRHSEPNGKYYIWDHKFDVAFNNGHVSSWYNNTNGFEFEFVVSDPIGVNKIFDNLQIISNNVQPDEMEITVIGDDYEFKRDLVNLTPAHKERAEYDDVEKIRTTSNTHGDNTYRSDTWTYKFDNRLNQKALVNLQQFKDIYKFGRRIGNIQYKDGSWFAQIEPLRMSITGAQQTKEVRIRDKWAKIRIRYSGKDLAIITAIKTLINI